MWLFLPTPLFLIIFIACVILNSWFKKKNMFNKYINRDCHNEMFSAVYSQTQAVLEWLNNSNYG